MPPRGWPQGRRQTEEHTQKIRNYHRERPATDVERAEPEEVQRGLASAVREGRVPPRYVSEIVRMWTPDPDPEGTEETHDGEDGEKD